MLTLIRFIAGLALLPLASPSRSSESDSRALYAATLQSSLKLIERKESKELIGKDMDTLMKLSQDILQQFSKAVPECKDYINQALKVAEQLPTMSLKKIESDYHADGALPKASAICHHAKDLLVHPATVLILLKEPKVDYGKMLAELTELSSHLTVVNQKIKK